MRYSRGFYEVQRMTSIESARVIIPLVIDLVQSRTTFSISWQACAAGAELRNRHLIPGTRTPRERCRGRDRHSR